jgi:hypothetical protein
MQKAGFQRPGLTNPVTVPSDPLVKPNREPEACGNHAQVVRDIHSSRMQMEAPFSNYGARLGAIERLRNGHVTQ